MKKFLHPDRCTYITIAFFTGLIALPFFIPSLSGIGNIIDISLSSTPANYILLSVPVILTVFLRKKAAEKDAFALLSCTYALLLTITYSEFIRANATFFFTTVAILLLSAVCINAEQPFASLVLIPGLFLRNFGTGYIIITYIPVLLILLMNYARREKEEKKSHLFTIGAYLYAVIFAVILFAKNKLTLSFSPVEFNPSSPVETAKIIAGCLLVLTACAMFIIRTLPLMKKSTLLFGISTALFAVFPLAGCVIGCLTGIISSQPVTVFLMMLLIYTSGHINLSLQDKSASPLLSEKHGNILLGFCGVLMCILVF